MARKKKMRLCASVQKTFEEGFQEFILDCKSRNLRQGTIIHYEVAIKQIYKRVPADTLISELSEKTMPEFIIALREDPNINDVSLGTYARDLKTILRFFMRCEYLPHFEITIPKTDKHHIETYTDGDSVFIIGIFQNVLHHQKGLVLLIFALVARNTLLLFLLCHAVTPTMVCR